jgi:hypothetical protein
VNDNDSSSPQSVEVSGLGTLVELSPILLRFGGTALGSSSTLPVTLTNVGPTAVTITSIAGIDDYKASHNCGSSVPPSGTCTINVTFTPTGSGSRPGALTIVSSDPASPQRVDLVASGLGITLQHGPLDFGSQTVGTTSAPKSVTITNVNKSSVMMGDISATDDFIISSNTCPATLAPQHGCTIQVEFSPDETGSISGTVYISDSDLSSPQKLLLSGTGQ